MTNRLFVSVATAALIASGVVANAQGTGGATGGSGGASPSAGSSAPAERGSAPQMDRSEGQGSGMNQGSGMKSGQSDDKMAPGGARDQRAQDGTPKGGASSDSGKAGKDDDRNIDRKAGNDRDQMNRNADKDRDPANRNAGNDRDRATTGQAGAGGKLSTEQRTKITTVIKNQRIEPQTNINFSISVGTRVPRDVRFHPLPTEIVTIYPDWRGYEFFLVRDEIIVVNPRTLEIVAVLDA
ncbi:DUF1236 domain-containing protein [Rhodopseudomonas pseudopalustris]|uniref:DUF1236 domain-containing protein n=1 Tax=Rhodopseudomonas pseudopalustris TaxID=1513892 RepID=A0A1H8W0M8_9BRAD|nr:DUF1236 domain-containing protein [Rhodopseudomonas pseudopalustris]SEP20718.1 Protein of unknown function [Rhodopseudomonas pseudopalustris]